MLTMPPALEFLGWDAPPLRRAVDRLVTPRAADGRLDLADTVAVTPGGRAGRRLIELLVDRAAADGLDLVPPDTRTPEGLAELLAGPAPRGRRVAGDAQQMLGWMTALRELPAPVQRRIVPQPPAADDLPGWAALAGLIRGVHLELAGARLGFADVPDRAALAMGPAEAARWRALAELADGYHALLDRAGLIDPQRHREDAIAAGPALRTEQVVLVGVSDMTPQLRAMLEPLAARVSVLVAAPGAMAERFDGWGAVIADAWADAPIALGDGRVAVVDRPVDQAIATLRTIEGYGGRHGVDAITIGLADAALTDVLRHWLPAYGVPVRDAQGTPMRRTAPLRLIESVAALIETRSFEAFATLLRHPDVGRWLVGAMPDGEPIENIDLWLQWADRYHADHLQARLSAQWLGRDQNAQRLRRVWQAVHGEGLVGELTGRRPLSRWAQPIVDLLRRVYGGRALHRHAPADRLVIEAAQRITQTAAALAELPQALDVTCPADQALRLVLGLLEGATVPPAGRTQAVEMLGYLELALDDGPAMIVTGFNEPHVPAAVTADAFLPEGLRRAINQAGGDGRVLTDNARRYARDAWALSVLLNCRDDVHLIAGQRGSDGDPIAPSRLLFAADEATIARRVAQWCGDPSPAPPVQPPEPFAPAQASAFELPPQRRIELGRPPD